MVNGSLRSGGEMNMATYTYDDLRVKFEPTADPGTYRVLAIDGAAGGHAEGTFVMPVRDDELRGAVVQASRQGTRDFGSDGETRVDPEVVGGLLADALLSGPVGALYADAVARVAPIVDRGVRLSLSLARSPRLIDVPWEFLFRRPRFLASQRRTPVVRVLEVDRPVPAAVIDGALSILGVIANPRGPNQLDVDTERSRVEHAIGDMREQGSVSLQWVQPATKRSLRAALRDGQYHIVHFIGHSDFTADGEGVIFLEGDDGTPVALDETLLANLVADQSATLRLVVLNSCNSGRSDPGDPQAGVAATLMALGLPAVVAMQFPISDRAAITFADELYGNLIGGRQPIDAAVSEARKAVFADVSETEWATAVLFLADPTAALFTFPAPQAPAGSIAGPGPDRRVPGLQVTGSGPVAIGGNVTITGGNVAGRDLTVGSPAGQRGDRR